MVASSRPRYASDAHSRIFPRCAYCASFATTTREGTEVCDEHRRFYDAGASVTLVFFTALTGLGVMLTAAGVAFTPRLLPLGIAATFLGGYLATHTFRVLWRRSADD